MISIQSSYLMENLLPAAAETFLLCAVCAILVVDVYLGDSKRWISYALSQFSLLVAMALTLMVSTDQVRTVFSGSYVQDGISDLLKLSIYAVAFLAFLYSRDSLRQQGLFKGEYYVIGLFAVLGMSVMASANSLLTVYLGLELLSLSLYSMVAIDRNSSASGEAAMKYFVLGAMASGFILYGISLVYGVAGTIEIPELAAALRQPNSIHPVMSLGVVFLVIGIAFKFGAVPFHMWLPDVYQGTQPAVALFVSSVPKIAAIALAVRVLYQGFHGMLTDWQGMLIVLAVLSMALGNLAAIAQTNIRRMFAYSTVSHVGFILLGIIAGNETGISGAMFYAITYALMAAAGFAFVVILSSKGVIADQLEDFKGLGKRQPWLALMMVLVMFSMAGVPPLVGFMAKWLVLQAIVDADLVWLAIVAVFFSIIGAFYYLRVVKLMYFDDPESSQPVSRMSPDVAVGLSVNGLAILYLGLFPSSLIALCVAAINQGLQ